MCDMNKLQMQSVPAAGQVTHSSDNHVLPACCLDMSSTCLPEHIVEPIKQDYMFKVITINMLLF